MTFTAHGGQATSTQYRFLDDQPYAGKNFYKLKSVDKDGGYSFSEIRTIDLNRIFVKIFPNPAKDWLNVELDNIPGNVQLKIYSTDGRLVFEKVIFPQAGNIKQSLDIRNLKAETYILQILTGDSKTQRLFIKN